MKKLIISAITAAALLFGFAGCSGDLHDVENTPYTNATGKVYFLGGISASTMNSDVEATKKAFADTQSYEVPIKDGKIKFSFTYSGSDSWSAGAGATAFAIVADATSDWDAANKMRWMTGADGIAVGSEGKLSLGSSSNVKITGLSAGTQYTLEAELTAAGGTMKVTQGLSGVPFELVWLNDKGESTNATSITAVNDYTFTYDITPVSEAKTYRFVARYGNDYYAPSADAEFKIDGITAEATKGTVATTYKALKVTIPSAKDAAEDHIGSYKVKLVYPNNDGERSNTDKLTASVEKVAIGMPYTLTSVFGTFARLNEKGNKESVGYTIVWDEGTNLGSGYNNGKPYVNKKVYTGTVTIPKDVEDAWGNGAAGRTFGVLTKEGDWSTKYTGAILENADTEYELISGATNNNLLALKTLSSDIKFTLKYIVYENTYSNGKYADEVGKFTISYSGTGEAADKPTYPPKWIQGSTGDIELTWNGKTATTEIDFASSYNDGWNHENPNTYTFGLQIYKNNWVYAFKEGAINLDGNAVSLNWAGAGGNNKITSNEKLAGKKVKLTFTSDNEKSVTCKAEIVK